MSVIAIFHQWLPKRVSYARASAKLGLLLPGRWLSLLYALLLLFVFLLQLLRLLLVALLDLLLSGLVGISLFHLLMFLILFLLKFPPLLFLVGVEFFLLLL